MDCTLRDAVYPSFSAQCSSLEPTPPGSNITRLFTGCNSDLKEGSWCYTRTYPNQSGFTGIYGFCAPECRGELPTRGSPHNLAGSSYDDLWVTRLFGLSTWGSGLCHTYNPPAASPPGSSGLLYALLGDRGKESGSLVLPGFRGLNIYLHSRDNFWPGLQVGVSFETSFDLKQPKLEPKLVPALSETKRLFRLFRRISMFLRLNRTNRRPTETVWQRVYLGIFQKI